MASNTSMKKRRETKKPSTSIRRSPRKTRSMRKDEKLLSAEEEARSSIHYTLKDFSVSDLSDNSSGERGQVRAEELHGDHCDANANDDSVCVFSEVVELTRPEGNTFDGPTKAQGQKSEALTLIVAAHHVTVET